MTNGVVRRLDFQASAVIVGAWSALSGSLGAVCQSVIYHPQQAPPAPLIFTDNQPGPFYPF